MMLRLTCIELPRSSEADTEALSLLSGAIQRTALLKGCCQSNFGRPLPLLARRLIGPQLSASPGFSMRLFSSLNDGVLHGHRSIASSSVTKQVLQAELP